MTKFYIHGDGLGFIKAKVYCHYTDNLNNNVEELGQYKDNIPVIALPEFEYAIIFA